MIKILSITAIFCIAGALFADNSFDAIVRDVALESEKFHRTPLELNPELKNYFIANLPDGAYIEVSYQLAGCFNFNKTDLIIRSKGKIRTIELKQDANASGKSIELTGAEIEALDKELLYYRDFVDTGVCTNTKTYRYTWHLVNNKEITEAYRDSSCSSLQSGFPHEMRSLEDFVKKLTPVDR